MSELRVELYDVKVTDGYWLRRVVHDRLRCEIHLTDELLMRFRDECKQAESEKSITRSYYSALGEVDKHLGCVPLLRSLDLITEDCYSKLADYYDECRGKIRDFYESALHGVFVDDDCDFVDDTEVEK